MCLDGHLCEHISLVFVCWNPCNLKSKLLLYISNKCFEFLTYKVSNSCKIYLECSFEYFDNSSNPRSHPRSSRKINNNIEWPTATEAIEKSSIRSPRGSSTSCPPRRTSPWSDWSCRCSLPQLPSSGWVREPQPCPSSPPYYARLQQRRLPKWPPKYWQSLPWLAVSEIKKWYHKMTMAYFDQMQCARTFRTIYWRVYCTYWNNR